MAHGVVPASVDDDDSEVVRPAAAGRRSAYVGSRIVYLASVVDCLVAAGRLVFGPLLAVASWYSFAIVTNNWSMFTACRCLRFFSSSCLGCRC